MRALTWRYAPAIEGASFAIGATCATIAAGGAAFAVGRWWRPSARRREEQIHRGLLSHAAQSIVSTDARGTIETFSRGAERLLGWTAIDVVGQRNLETFHDPEELRDRAADCAIESGSPIDASFATIVAGCSDNAAQPHEREWTWLGRDGTRVPVRLSITPMCDRRGRITGYLAIASDLTEHKLAEERRREFDTRLGKIASQVPGMVFQFKQRPDGTRCFPYASEGIREILRVEPQAVAHDSNLMWSLVHPEDVERMAASIDESALTLRRWRCEYRARFADGTIRWHEGTAMPERQPDGAVLWHGFISDITERKRAEQAAEENRVLLQSVFSTVDLGVFVVDVTSKGDFRFVEVNAAYERLTGIPASAIRGRSPRALVPLIPAEMAECLCASFRRGAESTAPIEFEEPFVVRGRLMWWLTRLSPLHDATGNVVRIVGRTLDITDRKAIELRFQSLTERLQLATEAAQVGIWDHDLNENRIMWDQRMHALYGITGQAFEGTEQGWRGRLHPDDVARIAQEHGDAVEGRKTFNTSFRVLWPDGSEHEIRACAHVQRNPAGRAVRMVGVNWDVTAERRAQAEIVRARDEAEDLNRRLQEALERAEGFAREAAAATTAKSEFLANMSHEIRTPLNAVIGMSGLLLGTDLSREQREFSETIRSSGDGLLGLINDILDYSKIESGRLDLEARPFDLRECIESALDVLAMRAAEKKLDLIYQMEGAPEMIVGDVTRLRQVIVNLLGNAVKFTAQGQVFVSVNSAPSPRAGMVRLHVAVHDSGIGIPADRMDRLFKTFSQVDASTTRHYGGTGLGLAITKKIVELMGGRIWAESTMGRGSTFRFEIEATAGEAAPKPWLAGRQPALAGRRVLIVDDNPTTARLLCQQCVAWGLMPRAAASAAEALRMLEQDDAFGLMLADVAMPEMCGMELAQQLRKTRSAAQLPIALLSWPGAARPPESLGIAGTLNKPLKPAAVFEFLTTIFCGRTAPPRAPGTEETNLAAEHPLTILLAEDNPVNQRVATLMLQRLGYRADVVANGDEALEAVARRAYDLVLMDVQMPEKDGLQATREICARWTPGARPRIVAMTANASTTDRDLCLAAGMDDFLTKPVRAAELRRAIEQTTPRSVPAAA